MRTLIIILGLTIAIVPLQAQPELLWSAAYGGGGQEQGLGIIELAEGGFALVGNEGSFGGGGTDGWIVVVDEEGDQVWSENFGGAGYDRFYDVIEIDDGFIVSGYTGSMGAGRFDFWLMMLDREGDQVWSRTYGGRDHERCSEAIRLDNGNYLLIGGTSSFGEGNGDAWVVMTDDEGDELWRQAYGGNQVDGLNMGFQIDEDEFVLTGHTGSFGAGGADMWFVRINDEGELLSSETFGGENDDHCYHAIQNDEGDFLLAGITVPDGDDDRDAILVKVNSEGEEIWTRVYEGEDAERCFSVTQTQSGGYLLAGNTLPYNDERADVLVLRTDEDGELLWTETYGGDQADVCRVGIMTDDWGYALYGWSGSFGAGGWDSWLVRLGVEPGGMLEGFVVNAEDDEPLEGATVSTSFGQRAETDDEGYWQIEFALMGEFSATASLPGYNSITRDGFNMEQDDTLEINFSMTHPEFFPSVDEIEAILNPEEVTDRHLSVRNDGNGPLEWSVDAGLRGELDANPWELRESYNFGEAVDDDRIQGVLFIDDLLYVSGANDGDPLIYVFNLNGDSVDTFEQPEDDRRGFRDMAYDGELIWGAVGETIYGISLDGEVQTSFESPLNITTVLTYDSDRECLWIGSTVNNIFAYRRDGEPFDDLEIDPDGLRIYGLAYWEDDPDDSPLYLFHEDREMELQAIHKVNIESGEIDFVTYLEPEAGGDPGGAFITNQLDFLSYVLITAVGNPPQEGGDRVDIWHIQGNSSWIQIEPEEGTIEPDDEQEFDLVLDAHDLIPIEYPGELVFTHNARGGETRIPVTLTITDEPHQSRQRIPLSLGWNLISARLQPEEEDVTVLTRDLVERELLLFMKDGEGHFYIPDENFNNIPGWDVAQGYKLKVAQRSELTLEGMTVAPDDTIQLSEGWQTISYYLWQSIEATVALSDLDDRLIIAKDGSGGFYIPEYNFSNLGNMSPGRGYMLKMSEDADLVYETDMEGERVDIYRAPYACTRLLPTHMPTGDNMSILVLVSSKAIGEIGAYINSELVGSGVIADGFCGISVWGDDPTTSYVDGALENELLEFKLVDESGSYPLDYETVVGEGIYRSDGLWVVEMKSAPLPSRMGIISTYPNPFNAQINITYEVPNETDVSLELFDLNGRLVTTLVEHRLTAGSHTTQHWDGSALTSGIYLIRLKSDTRTITRKIVLTK